MKQFDNHSHEWILSITMQDLLELMADRGVVMPDGLFLSDLTVTGCCSDPTTPSKPAVVIKGIIHTNETRTFPSQNRMKINEEV